MNAAPILKTTATDTYSVDPRNLVIAEGFNVRVDYGDIEGLAQSILESGVKVPLRAYRSKEDKEKFVLVDGHRRHRAAMMLVKKGHEIKVPLVLESKHYSEEERVLDMLRTNDGLSLTPIEKAEVVKRMVEFGWNEKQIAIKIGKSVTAVANMLQIANAPAKVKNMIMKNEITFTLALKEIRDCKDSTKLIERLTAAVAKSGTAGGSPKKVTAKSLKNSDNKVNSLSEFRKFRIGIIGQEDESIIFGKRETYDMLSKVLNGEVDRKEFEKYFLAGK